MSKIVSLRLLRGFMGNGPSNCDKRCLWEDLVGLLSWWNLMGCIGGDFTRFPSERLGEAHFSPL
jgi:hypothetical protein